MLGTKSPQNRISLLGVKLRPRLGVTPGERRFPQSCQADITIWRDFEAASSTDSLSETIDYSKVLAVVVEAAHAREFNLIETLAYRLARVVLESFPAERVNVRLRKHPASLVDKLDHVEVEVEES